MYSRHAGTANFKTVLDSFAQAPGLPFQEVLTAEHIERVAAAEHLCFGSAVGDIYSVAVTLWAFLAQVLSKEKARVAAVARVRVLRIALGLPPCAAETGAYCKARAKLSERFLQRLTCDLGQQVDVADRVWCSLVVSNNRRLRFYDGGRGSFLHLSGFAGPARGAAVAV